MHIYQSVTTNGCAHVSASEKRSHPFWPVQVGASDPPEPAGKDAVRTLNKLLGFVN